MRGAKGNSTCSLHLKLGEIQFIQELEWLTLVIKFQVYSFKEHPIFAD